jgi:GNAT superfamily N-acetyltransferase
MTKNTEYNIFLLKEKPEHLSICVHWSYAEWGVHVPTLTEEKLKKIYESRLENDDLPLMWVMLKDDRAIGMIGLKEHDHEERKDLSPWISSMYVDKEYRGQHLGKALLNHVINHAYTLGYTNTYLYTSLAEKFYQHNGWKKIDTVTDPMNKNQQAPIMVHSYK